MSFSVDELARIAIDLQSDIGHTDRFSRLITTLRQILGCDASALLRYEAHQFVPLAIDGLAQDVLGRRFALEGHPRLEAIARAGDVVRFPADSDLPDPYDGLIPGHESLKVHACVGLPLFAGQTLIGALTLDGMDADRFDSFSDEELRLIAALVAGALNNALLIARLEAQNVLPAQAVNYPLPERQEIIGLSGPMLQLKKEIDIVAASDLNVLISGETGTGKELVAKAVHQGSPRAANPLVYLNCAALPESVAESELFGHVKGAFTGAISNRSGKFEMADNGTLFLDEIGELSLAAKASYHLVLAWNAFAALVFITMRNVIPTFFTTNAEVIAIASQLMVFAALYQLSDGIQNVSVGILRGIQDVKIIMPIAFVSYWLLNLPVGYLFGFTLGMGPSGLFLGFSFGLSAAAVMMILRIRRSIRRLYLSGN